MRRDRMELLKNADLYIRYMLNGKKKCTYNVSIWGPDTIKIYYKNDIGKKRYHIVNQKQFIRKVSFYSQNKERG